jgi:hypothetical protein
VRRLTKCMEFEKRFSGRTAPRGRGAAPKLSRGVIAGATDTRHGPGSYLRTLENRIRSSQAMLAQSADRSSDHLDKLALLFAHIHGK